MRRLEMADWPHFESLLNRCFPVGAGTSFFDDFPVWGPLGRDVTVFGIWENSQLVAAAGLRFAQYQLPRGTFPVGIVGAVVTDESVRGRGYASVLTERLLVEASGAGVAAVFLWGSEHELYRRLGFELCGFQTRVPLRQIPQGATLPYGEIREGWVPDLFDAMRLRPLGLVLEERDRVWVSQHLNTQWFRYERAGKILAYAGFGKGIDLPGLVHEWGGETDSLLMLLREIAKRFPQAEILGRPDLLRLIGCAPEFEEVLCMAAVLDPDRIARVAGVGPVQWASGRERAIQCFGAPRELFSEFPKDRVTPPISLWFWGVDGA